MVLQKAPPGPNSMSIGIAKEGFKSHGSDGFGLSAFSWGIIESRATSEGKLYANRQSVGNFRKMQEGDIFNILYSYNEGKAWLIIYNLRSSDGSRELGGRAQYNIDLCQQFTLHPPGEGFNLVVGATYCNVSVLHAKFFYFMIQLSSI